MAYNKIVDYAAKDALISGNPAKLIKGTELGAEFDAVAAASALAVDLSSVQTLVNKTLTAPVMTAPVLGTPASGVATNLTGTAAGLTAGTATTANALNTANSYTAKNYTATEIGVTVGGSGVYSALSMYSDSTFRGRVIATSTGVGFRGSADTTAFYIANGTVNAVAEGNLTVNGGTVTATTFAGNASTATTLSASPTAGASEIFTSVLAGNTTPPSAYSPFEAAVLDGTLVEIGNVRINKAGTYRVAISGYESVGQPANGRIYKNGVAFGTARSFAVTSYLEYTEDLTFAAGDTVQFFAAAYGTAVTGYFRNFSFRVASTANIIPPSQLSIGAR